MNFLEATLAIQDAENTIRAADNMADRLARILVGRLRKVCSVTVLSQLKKELSQFNAHTGTWKEEK